MEYDEALEKFVARFDKDTLIYIDKDGNKCYGYDRILNFQIEKYGDVHICHIITQDLGNIRIYEYTMDKDGNIDLDEIWLKTGFIEKAVAKI